MSDFYPTKGGFPILEFLVAIFMVFCIFVIITILRQDADMSEEVRLNHLCYKVNTDSLSVSEILECEKFIKGKENASTVDF